MIAFLCLCIVFAVVVFFLVVQPLWSNKNEDILLSYTSAINSKKELETVLNERDKLMQKLLEITKKPELTTDHEKEKILNTLIDLCTKLKKAGLPFLLLLLCMNTFNTAQAQNHIQIPELLKLKDDIYVAPIHQFIIYPTQKGLWVQYLAMFSKNQSDNKKTVALLLPFPKGAQDINLNSQRAGIVEAFSKETTAGLLRFEPQSGVNEVKVDFKLNADWDSVEWNNPTLKFLPGMIVFVLPDELLQISSVAEGFEIKTFSEPAQPEHPIARHMTSPLQHKVTYMVRSPQNSSNSYPSFTITNTPINRTIFYILAFVFAGMLLSLLIAKTIRLSSAPSQKN